MSFSEFGEIVKQLELSPTNNTKVYLQTALKLADLSDEMQDYLFQFNYLWLNSLAHKLQWGDIDTNLLLVGMPEVVTPAHYDGMENLFTQVLGQKRCILFNPLQYRNLYPHPVHHPHDRQTQINFDAPDYNKFPRFRDAVGYEAIVRPGDLLYIPLNWWHYIESNSDSMTISINFWFSADLDTSEDNDTITPQTENNEASEEELLQLMREIENSVGEKLKDKKQVKEFLLDIIDGRFDSLE
ncbi:hypoxia-inducible factor 1-alpha inhibitor-like [Corticium candelabrum]|uniref:hypoxia-inducible factor 1-alpha inhibitor-like n=1 Tax=Corticium candelabrum TaxID=121492 RepID=UPI002E266536|nr:hypoxia-inducible factor 1-alpha inhibitor-like [Corticium candelabrum]